MGTILVNQKRSKEIAKISDQELLDMRVLAEIAFVIGLYLLENLCA